MKDFIFDSIKLEARKKLEPLIQGHVRPCPRPLPGCGIPQRLMESAFQIRQEVFQTRVLTRITACPIVASEVAHM